MDVPRASSMSSGLPPRGSFSAQMAFMDDSRVPELPLSDDDDNSNAFEYLPDDHHISSVRLPAPSPSPPPPPPSPPVLPFRNAQRVRVKSMNFPSESSASKMQSARRATTSEAATSGTRAQSTSISGGRVIPSQPKVSDNRARGSIAASILGTGVANNKTQEVQEREAEATAQSAPSPSLIPVPSVHPIDTLSKKLREQAEELTRVYEQLATQRERIASYKSESQAQKLEIERLKLSLKYQRDELNAAAAPSRRVAASSMSARGAVPTSGGGNVTKTTLNRKMKEAEQEKQRYAVASKQLEAVIDDVQRYFRERHHTSIEDGEEEAKHGGQGVHTTLEEQRVYIRVLEEVVHLKASEFQVSSHEELLVVLAELRHTIYEQEKELEQQRQRINDAEARLLEEKQVHLQVREQLDHQRRECDDIGSSARAHESEMRQQLLNVQRELQQYRDQLQQALATCDKLRGCERDLERRLTRESGELEATRTRLEQTVRSCDEMKERLEQATAKADDATRQAKHWEAEASRRQTHLDEMNALQEELLDSITETSGSQERSSERAKQLEQELQISQQRETETTSKLEDLTIRTDNERKQLKQRLEGLKLLNEQMDTQCSSLREQAQELDESLVETQRQLQEHIERADVTQQQLDIREKEVSKYREAVVQMEAALSAALQVITAPGRSIKWMNSSEDGGESASDGVNGVEGCSDDGTMDANAVKDMCTCCAALDSLLPSDNETVSPWPDVSLPSLRELLAQLLLAGSRLVSEVEHARESWARERRDLRSACAVLEDASRLCQLEMDQRHRQLLDCQRALADRGLQVEVMAIESEALADQFAALQVVLEEKRALEQRLDELVGEVERNQSAINALEDELYAQQSEKETLVAQLQDAQRQLEQQNGQLGELNELRERIRVLSSELNDALALSEEQNEWNQQLVNEVERQEQAAATHNVLIRELEARERAFTRRFTQLFEQFAIESDDHSSYSAGEGGYGALLKRLQAFPLVVEQYIARCSALGFSGHVQKTVDDVENTVIDGDLRSKSSSGRRKGIDRARDASFEVKKVVPTLREGGSASEKLDEQLELIRAAFQAVRKGSG